MLRIAVMDSKLQEMVYFGPVPLIERELVIKKPRQSSCELCLAVEEGCCER